MGDASVACGETDKPLIVPQLWVGRGGEGKGEFSLLTFNE
jgi:hypothetical protein